MHGLNCVIYYTKQIPLRIMEVNIKLTKIIRSNYHQTNSRFFFENERSDQSK